jgi:hypothetical protein
MARGARGTVTLDFSILEFDTDASGFGATSVLLHAIAKALQLENGTADGQVDRVWSASANATTSPTTIDLIGSLTGQIDGGTVTSFADAQCLYVENTSTSGNLLVGGGTNPIGLVTGTAESLVIPPGGWALINFGNTGLACVNSSSDVLTLKASAGTVGYRVAIVGRSA